jgi:hypothetical protein
MEQLGRSDDTMTVLFVMRSLAYLRFFQAPLELLVERGHDVRLLMQHQHGTTARARRIDSTDDATQWVERMQAQPNFSCDIVDHFEDRRSVRMESLRRGIEYVRFADPRFRTWTYMYEKRRRGAPPRIRRLASWPVVGTPTGLRLLARVLSALERLLPAPAQPRAYVAALRPDVVALCDSTAPGSLLSAYAQAAKELGIPVAEFVASWDNLTNRQRLRVLPDRLVVWNNKQLEEAREHHGVPPERVAVCGAPAFDKWFSWQPRAREEFLGRLGLDPAKPMILWLGGALYPSRRTEAEYASQWLAALRHSGDGTLREAGVILRPHPYRMEEWQTVDVAPLGNAVIWPREGGMPVDRERQADLYDSIFHSAAVIGLNTSAMIEAAIVGRPVLTILEPEFQSAQLDTFHFEYLLESSGGAVRPTGSVDESLAELGSLLADSADASARAKRFAHDFVRPNGLDQPATPLFVDVIERLAETPVRVERDPLWIAAGRAAITGLERPFLASYDAYGSLRRAIHKGARANARRIERSRKRARRFALVRVRAGLRSRIQGRRGRRTRPARARAARR